MVGEQQVAAVGSEGFQGVDGGSRGEAAGQLLPATVDAYAVAHHPAGGVLLNVEVVDGGGGQQCALAGVNVVLLEPCYGVFLIGTLGVVVRHEHGQLRATLFRLVGNIEAHGLALGDAAVGIAGLHRVGHVDIGGSFLDKVAADHFVEVSHVGIVFDNLNTGLALHGGVLPVEGDGAAALLIVGYQVADALAIGSGLKLYVAAGGNEEGDCADSAVY